MVSTSAFEIGFAAAETADVPAGAAEGPVAVPVDGGGAEVPFAEPAVGGGAEEPAAAVTLAACLEPKMADTMLPKTLILSSCVVALRSHGIAGWFARMSRGAMWRGFRCLTLDCCEPGD